MNLDNRRLKEIQQYKLFYQRRLEEEDNTELEEDLLRMKFKALEAEEKEILKRCDAL